MARPAGRPARRPRRQRRRRLRGGGAGPPGPDRRSAALGGLGGDARERLGRRPSPAGPYRRAGEPPPLGSAPRRRGGSLLEVTDERDAWEAAMLVNRGCGYPWDEALCSWRFAQALLRGDGACGRAAEPLRRAHAVSAALGAAPLTGRSRRWRARPTSRCRRCLVRHRRCTDPFRGSPSCRTPSPSRSVWPRPPPRAPPPWCSHGVTGAGAEGADPSYAGVAPATVISAPLSTDTTLDVRRFVAGAVAGLALGAGATAAAGSTRRSHGHATA